MSCTFSVRVVDHTDSKKQLLLMPWNFVETDHTLYSYASLYVDIKSGFYPPCEIDTGDHFPELLFRPASSSFALKEEIRGDPSHDIIDKIITFGMRFFTLHTKRYEASSSASSGIEMSNLQRDAFKVLMAAAASEVGKNVPKEIDSPKNGFDRLFNDVLRHLSISGCSFPINVGPAANMFVSTLTKLLWYLDGHYYKIVQEFPVGQKIPEIFKTKFSGYNCPEKSKH